MHITEEEKNTLRQAKDAVTERLRAADIASYELKKTDVRLEEYCKEVAENPQCHNLFEQLAVERFLRMVRQYGLNRAEVLKFFTL